MADLISHTERSPWFTSARRNLLLLAALLGLSLPGICEVRVVGETAQEYFGQTPEAELARAAAEGKVDEVKRLATAGGKVNGTGTGKQSMTPLVWALSARNPQGMRALLEVGADPNQRVGPEKQFHPVWLAAGQDEPGPLAVLLEFKGDPNAVHKGADYVPLMRAKTKLTNVKLLVQGGADINVANSLGAPMVQSAANLAQYDVVMYALQNGFVRNLPLLAWELNDRRPGGRVPLPPELEPKRLQALGMLREMGVTPPPGKAPPLQAH